MGLRPMPGGSHHIGSFSARHQQAVLDDAECFSGAEGIGSVLFHA